ARRSREGRIVAGERRDRHAEPRREERDRLEGWANALLFNRADVAARVLAVAEARQREAPLRPLVVQPRAKAGRGNHPATWFRACVFFQETSVSGASSPWLRVLRACRASDASGLVAASARVASRSWRSCRGGDRRGWRGD